MTNVYVHIFPSNVDLYIYQIIRKCYFFFLQKYFKQGIFCVGNKMALNLSCLYVKDLKIVLFISISSCKMIEIYSSILNRTPSNVVMTTFEG